MEDDELKVAAQHLTQDFLCQVIQEEEGRDRKTVDGEQEAESEKEGVGPQRQAAPLAVILGKLPSAASLGLQQTFDASETSEKAEGETRNMDLRQKVQGSLVFTGCSWCFTEEQSQGGELDLHGIDDQEIDKVSSLLITAVSVPPALQRKIQTCNLSDVSICTTDSSQLSSKCWFLFEFLLESLHLHGAGDPQLVHQRRRDTCKAEETWRFMIMFMTAAPCSNSRELMMEDEVHQLLKSLNLKISTRLQNTEMFGFSPEAFSLVKNHRSGHFSDSQSLILQRF